MPQSHSQSAPTRTGAAGDPADVLANVRSLADCLEEWAVQQRCPSRVPAVAVVPHTKAGDTITTIEQELFPC